jgi:hypothetical protein
MLKKMFAMAALIGAAAASATPALAGDDSVIGALLGAGVGAVIGHSVGGDRGAVIGGAVGALTGASIAHAEGRYERTHYEAPREYYPPPPQPSYFPEAPVVERRPVVVERITYPPRWHRHWNDRYDHERRVPDRNREYRHDRDGRNADRYGHDQGYRWR